MNSTTYRKLSTAGVLAVPVAPAAFLGLRLFAQGQREAVELFGSSDLTAVFLLLATAAGITAVGLELVGILSGHVTAKLYQRQDGRWKLTAIALIAYTILGWSALRGTAGAFAFLIAPLIYLVAAINTAADEQHEETQATAAERTAAAERAAAEREAAEREERRSRLALERELALRREEHEHEQRLAQAEQRSKERLAKTAAPPAAPRATPPAKPGSFPVNQRPRAAAADGPQASLYCAGCGYEASSVNALKGHQRWCNSYKVWKAEADEVTAPPQASANGYH